MKYLLFGGEAFYPLGGYEDFIGTYTSIAKAKKAWEKKLIEEDYYVCWSHIVCKNKIILSFEKNECYDETTKWE